MSDALRVLTDAVQDGKESRKVLDVLTDLQAQVDALKANQTAEAVASDEETV